jgi:WD40 repeat protein
MLLTRFGCAVLVLLTGGLLSGASTAPGKTPPSWAQSKETPQGNAEEWHEVAVLRVQNGSCLGFTPDGKALVLASFNGALAHLDLATNKERILTPGEAGVDYGRFRFWTLSADRKTVTAVDAPPSQQVLQGKNGRLVFWDAVTGKEKQAFELPDCTSIMCLAISPDGGMVACGRGDSIQLWDVKTGKSHILAGHVDLIRSLDFAANGKILASASHDKTIKLWDLATRKEMRTLQAPQKVYLVLFTPDVKSLLTATMNGNDADCDHVLQLWEVETGKERLTLYKDRHCYVMWAAFSASGTRLVTSIIYTPKWSPRVRPAPKPKEALLFSRVRLWNLTTGTELLALKNSGVGSFSPDGKRLLISGNTVTLWEGK